MRIEVGDRGLCTPAECYVCGEGRVLNLNVLFVGVMSKDKTRRKIKKCWKTQRPTDINCPNFSIYSKAGKYVDTIGSDTSAPLMFNRTHVLIAQFQTLPIRVGNTGARLEDFASRR